MRLQSLSDLVEDYLAARRHLGFNVERHGWLLRNFARFTDRIGYHGPITVDLALHWVMASCPGEPLRAERRLSAVRQFARHLSALEPRTEIPPTGLLGCAKGRRCQPHIYSDPEISTLLQECSRLLPHEGLRPITYVAFFSLLTSTGLRLSEACRLHRRDVDLREGLLTVRESKFGKSRLVPLHPTAVQALTRYAAQRDTFRSARQSEFFFSTDRASVLSRHVVGQTFSSLRNRLGWTANGRARRPRIHDMRQHAENLIMPSKEAESLRHFV